MDDPVVVPTARIVSAATGKCLTAGSQSAGTALAIQSCGGAAATRTWALHGDDHTLRIGADLCMGPVGGSVSDGTTIQLQRCDGSDGQKFKINATEDLVSLKTGDQCSGVWQGSTADGTPVKLWPCSGTANQTWRRG